MVWLPDVCPVAVPSTYLVELQDAVDGRLAVVVVPVAVPSTYLVELQDAVDACAAGFVVPG